MQENWKTSALQLIKIISKTEFRDLLERVFSNYQQILTKNTFGRSLLNGKY